MKNYFSYLFLLSILHFAVSCNQSNKETSSGGLTKKSTKYNFEFIDTLSNTINTPVQGIDVFYIPDTVAKPMIDSFETNYRRHQGQIIYAFKNRYWINACTLNYLSNYLDTSTKKYDGARIYFMCDLNDNSGHTGSFKKNTFIKMFPTTKRIPIDTTKSNHVDDIDGIKFSANSCIQNDNFGTWASCRNNINMFSSVYHARLSEVGSNRKKVLTKSLWIDTTVIRFLAKLVSNNLDNVDGINILTASYRGKPWDILPKDAKAKQSTLIMVPSKTNTPAHDNNWEIIDSLIKVIETKKAAKANFWGGGLNKAELCPQVCN